MNVRATSNCLGAAVGLVLVTHFLMQAAAPQPRSQAPGFYRTTMIGDYEIAAISDGTVPQALPPPGAYEIDPPHTFAYFDARHDVVGLVRGRFDKVAGTITVAKDPAACSLDVTIDASSISTQNILRDEDLRGPDFFDVKNFPTMTYHGRGIRRVSGGACVSGGAWMMDGSLTIRGVTKVVPLRFTFNGTAPPQPGEPARVAFHGSAATKRAEFGMTRDLLQELGASPSPGQDVEIEIDSEALTKISTPPTEEKP